MVNTDICKDAFCFPNLKTKNKQTLLQFSGKRTAKKLKTLHGAYYIPPLAPPPPRGWAITYPPHQYSSKPPVWNQPSPATAKTFSTHCPSPLPACSEAKERGAPHSGITKLCKPRRAYVPGISQRPAEGGGGWLDPEKRGLVPRNQI